MAETVIFAEQTLEFSDDSSGLYIAQNKEPFVPESGKTYRVIWDGQEFTLNSFNFKMEGFDGIGIGNEAFFTGVSTELTEPFSVYYLTSSGYSAIVTTDNSASHTVAIYLVEESLSVVVKDRTGADVEYSGVAGIRVRTTGGGTKEFVDASSTLIGVETSIELNFSSGDMVVLPDDGEAFSQVSIPMPVNLIADNIAKDINIAGIIGKFKGGAGVYIETFTASATTKTIHHGLGVVPDLIYVSSNISTATSEDRQIQIAVGVSSKIFDLYPYIIAMVCQQKYLTGGFTASNTLSGVNRLGCYDMSSTMPIRNANEESFVVGGSAAAYGYLKPDATYLVIAIADLA